MKIIALASAAHVERSRKKPAIKNLIITFILAAALALIYPASAYADVRQTDKIGGSTIEERGISIATAPSIDASYAYVVDSTGKVYFERDSETATPIASLTKVMTAIVALDNADLDSKYQVSEAAAKIGESTAYLKAGDIISLEDALYGLLLPSGNDAALVIAEGVGAEVLEKSYKAGEALYRNDGSLIAREDPSAAHDAFIAKMNSKSEELGLDDTLFTNPHGLDINEFDGELHSTAKDVSKIAADAMKNETFREIVRQTSATIEVERDGGRMPIVVESTDILNGSYNGACGIKTGYTSSAGSCFVGACNKDDLEIYAVVLHSTTNDQRFIDTKALYEWVYGSIENYKLANSSYSKDASAISLGEECPVVAEVSLSDWTDKTVACTFSDPNVSVKVNSIFGNISQVFNLEDKSGGVSAGEVLGTADFYQHNEYLTTVDIIAIEDISAPNIFETIGVAFTRFANFFTGGDDVAKTIIHNTTPLILEKV